MAGGSLNAVWIPAFAVAHAIGLALFIYALEQTSGLLTYVTWTIKYHLFYKKKFNGNFGLAWYYTYPGAKEAHDAKQASSAQQEDVRPSSQTPVFELS